MVYNLVDEHGFPNYIIYSPFLRTRQTMEKIYINLKLINPLHDIKLICDVNIGEYLGFQRPVGDIADVEKTTSIYYPDKKILLGETIEQLRSRSYEHIKSLEKIDGIIWVITHGFVIKHIAENLNKIYKANLPRDIDLNTLGHLEYNF